MTNTWMDEPALSLLFAAADVGRSLNIKCERQNVNGARASEREHTFTVCAGEWARELIYGRS